MISKKRCLVSAIIVLMGALVPSFAQTQTGQTSGLTETPKTITVNPKLKPYQLRLVYTNTPQTDDPRLVARIVITRAGQSEAIQTLDIKSSCDDGLVSQFFKIEDINFDGYLDIAAPLAHGAKWMSFNYWVFDAQSGKFITNVLTKQLRGLGGNEMILSPKEQTIHVTRLNLGGEGTLVGEVYKVENNLLHVIAVERLVPAGAGKPNEFVPKRFKPTAADLRRFPPKEHD